MSGPYKSTAQCWRDYPKLPFPDNVGARGTAQKRAREACVAASMAGRPDPELATGPSILQDPVALWRSKEPWKERPYDRFGAAVRTAGRILDPSGVFGIKTGGDYARSTGEGWRPPTMTGMDRFAELERKATVAGGIDALSAAGIHPWSAAADRIANQKPLKLRSKHSDGALLQAAQGAAQALGRRQPKDMREAAEFIRAEVIRHRLEKAAWVARASRMAMAARLAQKKRQALEMSVSTVTGVAATATSWFPPVGLALTAVSLGTGAASARTSIEQTRSKAAFEKYVLAFEHAVEERNYRMHYNAVLAQLALLEGEEAVSAREGQKEGAQTAKYIQGALWVGTASLTTLGIYLVASRLRRK